MWKNSGADKKSSAIQLEEDYTFLAKGGTLEGTANLKGVVRIDGNFQGIIYTSDTLIVGENAVIRGTVKAREIICSGKLQAELIVETKIHLLKPAVLLGKISTPALIMEEGAFFQGTCDMGLNPVEDKVHEPLPETEPTLVSLPEPVVA